MNGLKFTFSASDFVALPSGALFWPDQNLLCVSDLHFGKSERTARCGGGLLPPYEVRETLEKLDADLAMTGAEIMVCLGDSFDDLASVQALSDDENMWLLRLMAGRHWVWIEGNHDPGPIGFGGTHQTEYSVGQITFRHITDRNETGEISGHYHPKARLPGRIGTRACFLLDEHRMILPAYGTYTGGLRSDDQVISDLMGDDALAILLAAPPVLMPMPKRAGS